MINDGKYQAVLEANRLLHTVMANDYHNEPHFRPENVNNVRKKLRGILKEIDAKRMLDLGCGTGFLIDIARPLVQEIHGVDVTQAMLDKVDTSGPATIKLINHDTGNLPVETGYFDIVTAYSFLHHLYDITPTLETAYKALREGGIVYVDLEPNYYFWKPISQLNPKYGYDPIIAREIQMVTFIDDKVASEYGIEKGVMNLAEFGKNVQGGFREDPLRRILEDIGFRDVSIFYYWFLGQGAIINDQAVASEERFRHADFMDEMLQRALPISRPMFKYLGFTAAR